MKTVREQAHLRILMKSSLYVDVPSNGDLLLVMLQGGAPPALLRCRCVGCVYLQVSML